MGFGVGIKPSIAIFAISSALVLGAFQKTWSRRIEALIAYGVGGAIGATLSAGFWWHEMWLRFGNPFFPFYNHIFQSPYFTSNKIIWSTFIPKESWEYFFWPFLFSTNGYRVNQIQFYDIRFAFLFILFLVWGITFLVQKIFKIGIDKNKFLSSSFFKIREGNFLLIFFLISYILWIVESATYRFIIPLEILTPLCFLVILERFVSNIKLRSIIIICVLIITFIYFKPFHWGRLDWTPSYFSVDASLFVDKKEPMVIMLGESPTSYIIPHFPPNYRFVRPEGNLFIEDNDFLRDIKNLLKQHKGNFYILYEKNNPKIWIDESLMRLELDLKIQDCFLLVINTPDELMFCSLDSSE